MSSCHVARLGDFEKYLYKIVHGLTLLHGSLRELVASYQHLSLFYLTGSDDIDGVSMDEVECHLLGPNLLQDQRLDPQVYTHIYD